MSGTPGLQEDQIRKAVAALLKHVERQQAKANELLEEDELLYLIIALKKTPQDRRKDKPRRIPLPHPLYDFDGAEVCLIVKDHKGEGHKAAKERVREQKLAKVSKVVGVSKLRTKYESAEAKRALCAAYDLFLADERVLPSLPKLLGKSFFKKKKQPIPVDLTVKDWAAQVRKATEATYLHHTGGTCINIRVARSSFSAEQCTENILEAVKGALPHIPRKWANVQALHLKAANSAALPIYQTLPEQPQRIAVPK
ncbi:Ribosomal L1 domain-containing protein 1 [Coccomyxa sp. Obi]|nr:Ribosomal L1 domain-containing protein 1 [Coccomyxa sp. Obi]